MGWIRPLTDPPLTPSSGGCHPVPHQPRDGLVRGCVESKIRKHTPPECSSQLMLSQTSWSAYYKNLRISLLRVEDKQPKEHQT